MRKITWRNCTNSLKASTILFFCKNNPLLRYVHINSAAVTDALLEDIVSNCIILNTVFLHEKCGATISVVNTIAAMRSHIKLTVCNISFDVVECAGGRVCDVEWQGKCSSASVLSVLNTLRLPIRQLTQHSCDHWVYLNKQSLRLLVEKSGHALQRVEAAFENDVEREDVQHLLQCCPQLQSIFFTVQARRSLFGDEEVRNLPFTCPYLTRLCFIDCAIGITDEAVIAALEALSHNDIQSVILEGCANLTDAVLRKVDECCPNIATVSTHGTAITKEAALEFLLSKEKSSLQDFDGPSDDAKQWIREQAKLKKRFFLSASSAWLLER